MRSGSRFALALFAATFALHLWNIGQDLPFLYNVDEPHHIHVAAHFSTGDLNPHDFKYPTFWPYVVAVLLGLTYVGSLAAGAVSSSREFAVRFFADPTVVYLVVRSAAALFVSLTPVMVFLAGRRAFGPPAGIAAGLFACLSPMVVTYGRDATHYSLLFFLLAAAMYFFVAVGDAGGRRNYVLAGLFLGLAASTYYLAAPLGLIMIGMHAMRPKSERVHAHLAVGVACAAAAFFAASPFILLDFPAFHRQFTSLHEIQKNNPTPFSVWSNAFSVLKNTVRFLDRWGVGFVFALVGVGAAPRRERLWFLWWTLPLLLMLVYLSRSYFGFVERYGYCAQMPLYLMAGRGFAAVFRSLAHPAARATVAVAVFFPPAVAAVRFTDHLGLPDTRTLARRWIDARVPAGSSFLTYGQFHSVPIDMSRRQIEELLERTKEINHPRRHYYDLLLAGAGEGGHTVHFLKRPMAEVQDIPDRTEKGSQALPLLDADALGLEGLKENGVDYVVVDELFWVTRRDVPWMRALTKEGELVFESRPKAGEVKGPAIRIYRLS